jgi:2-methylcitrate dehydratase PrpD
LALSSKGVAITIARTLATFVANADAAELPAQTLDYATMLIASTLASAAVGRDISSAVVIRELVQERGGQEDATIWFDKGAKLPAVSAARANALMSDAAASDDSDLRNITHAGTPLTAASFAIAEKISATGLDILAAIVLGYEAAGRIGASITPGFRKRGFHACIIAIFSGAVATARLLKLDAEKMTHTIALAATSIGGLVAAGNESVAREYHGGNATMLGMEAAMAAAKGFTAEYRIFEMSGGFCETYGNQNSEDSASIVADLGHEWDIVTDMAIKLVPGSHFSHTTAEAAANAARKGNIAPDEVAAIVLSRPGLTKFAEPLHPIDLVGMAHSTAYFLAAGVADRTFGWAHATQEKIDDPVIHGLIDKAEIGPQPTENVAAYRQGATVVIKTKDGRSFEDTVLVPNGAGCRGIDWADVDVKYRALTPAALMPEQVEESLKIIHGFRDLPKISTLIDQLR